MLCDMTVLRLKCTFQLKVAIAIVLYAGQADNKKNTPISLPIGRVDGSDLTKV